MRVLIMFLMAILFGTGMTLAQVPEGMDVTAKFGESLANLKSSAASLSAGNAALVARNAELKAHLSKLQVELQQSADESNRLTRAALKLQDVNPTFAKQTAELEREIFEIDNKMELLAQEIRTAKESTENSRAEDLKLTQRMEEIKKSMPPPPPPPPDRSKEKLRLLKMIYESKQQQANLDRQMTDIQKQLPVIDPMQALTQRKDALNQQIQQIQTAINELNKAVPEPVGPRGEAWTSQQMDELEAQVKNLQKNHDELEDLVDRMQQKAHKTAMTADERKEHERLQSNLDDLNKEGKVLKANLNDLRRQMVELDKRKSNLQSAK